MENIGWNNATDRIVVAPLQVQLPEIDSLPHSEREIVQEMLNHLGKNFNYNKVFVANFPKSNFNFDRGHEIQCGLHVPDSDEIRRLALDENGDQRNTSPSQYTQIREKGEFVVESVEFPGQQHRWKIHSFLQIGIKNSKLYFFKVLGSIITNLVVRIPERLSSLGNYFSNSYDGIKGIMGVIIGIPEKAPEYDISEISDEITKQREAFLSAKVGSSDEYGPFLQSLDLRLFDIQYMKPINSAVSKLQKDFNRIWEIGEYELRMSEKEILGKQLSGSALKFSLDQRMQELKTKAWYEKLLGFEGSDDFQEEWNGITELLVNRAKAEEIKKSVNVEIYGLIDEKRKQIRAEVKEKHAFLSLSSVWLDKKVDHIMANGEEKALREEETNRIPLILERELLHQEAFISRTNLEFDAEKKPKIEAEMTKKMVPIWLDPITHRIWNPKNWKIEKIENGVRGHYYVAIKHHESSVKAWYFFWRFDYLLRRIRAAFMDGNYNLTLVLFYSSPFGIRSMFLMRPFHPAFELNRNTGRIEKDTSFTVQTYVSSLRNLWNGILEDRRHFEALPDTGLIGRRISRIPHVLWCYIIRGVGGTFLIGVGQPILFLLVTVAAIFGVVTSPVWAVGFSVLAWLFNILIYDWILSDARSGYQHYSFVPFFMYAYAVIKGVCQVVLSIAAAAVWHPLYSVFYGLWGGLSTGLRMMWDGLVGQIVLKHARMPLRDSWAAWRIAGPGLSQKYYFNVAKEDIMVAVQAFLELKELRLFHEIIQRAIKEPKQKYSDFIDRTLSSFGVRSGGSTIYNVLDTAEKAQLKCFSDMYSKRLRVLEKLYGVYSNLRSSIKQDASSLAETCADGAQVVQGFFENKLKEQAQLSDSQMQPLWREADVKVDDYEGYTRYLLTRIFGEDFLTPLEINDQTFVIAAKNSNLQDWISEIYF